MFKQGDKIRVTVYGAEKRGTVSRVGRTGIVFVILDESGRERWFHSESLALVVDEKESAQ